MTTGGSSEQAGSDHDQQHSDDEATMLTDPVETTDLTDDTDAGAEADEAYVPPRSTRRSSEIPLGRVMSDDAFAHLFGMPNVVRDINKMVIPDMDQWKRDMLPAFEAIQRMVMPDMTEWKRRMLPTMEALIEGLKPSLDAAHSTINMTGITDALSIFGDRHAQVMKSISPDFNAATMLGITSSLSLVAGTLSRISEINPDLNVEEIGEAALQAVGEVDQEAALQAVLEAIEVEFDPDSLPTPEEVTALKSFAGLLVMLRPSLRDDPEVGRWLLGMTTGTTFQILVYLAIAHPGILATLFIITGITSSTKWVHSQATTLFLPGKDEEAAEDEEDDTEV